ncbi:hypothetical protein M5K25_022530 [Dendrobium thyrsiflorum]|uniref:Uncharacterized protein n=1 Tax=Dendrobium thyrsiflorum TaxID=117978 RepID=A0ABD0UCH6_DENTH
MSRKDKLNDTKFDSIRAQMGPNQRFEASLEGIQMPNKRSMIKRINIGRPFKPLPMCPLSTSYLLGGGAKRRKKEEPKQRRGGIRKNLSKEEEEKELLSWHQAPPRPPPGLLPDHQLSLDFRPAAY